MKKTIRIMIIEDSPTYREGIACALEAQPGMEPIREFGTAEIALRSLAETCPDIILLDLNLPGMSGLDAIPPIREKAPETKIIVLTQSDKETDVLRAIRLGAAGYLLKSASIEQLMNGIQCVHEGGATLDQSLARYVLGALSQTPTKAVAGIGLSNRELEVLTLLAEGLAQKQIASRLEISIYTVAEYIHNIYEKLNVPNAPAAISKAYKTGLFPRD